MAPGDGFGTTGPKGLRRHNCVVVPNDDAKDGRFFGMAKLQIFFGGVNFLL
ncbi:MAG: hypothetical protein O3C60_06775 [Planctomycetota bacterium]|nr:hypothetical protein [Planctomycetota bacterium]